MFVQNDGPTFSFFCIWGCHKQGYASHELARDAFIEHDCTSMRGQ